MQCPRCDRPVDNVSNRFCPWCGQKLPEGASVAAGSVSSNQNTQPSRAYPDAPPRDTSPSQEMYREPVQTEPMPDNWQTGAYPSATRSGYVPAAGTGVQPRVAPRQPWAAPARPAEPNRTPLVVGGVAALVVVAIICVVVAAATLANGGKHTSSVVSTNPQPTATVVQHLVVSDTLATNKSGWLVDANCFFKGGSYHVKDSRYCYRGDSYNDTTVSVDVQQVDGALTNPYGLVVGISGAGTYYSFMVTGSGSGTWRLNQCVKYKCTALLPVGKATALNGALNTTNTLKVAVAGIHFVLFINNQQVGAVDDSAYKGGQVGFIAGSKVEAAYNNLTIMAPAK